MPAWKKAAKPVVATIGFLKESIEKDIPHILVDLRSSEDARKGHIQGAVSMPEAGIDNAKGLFPADKKAPIVLYAADTRQAMAAFATVRGWGYSNTVALEGGIAAWVKAGNAVSSGELKTAINYVPKPRAGEIPVEEFKRVVETLQSAQMILDVRDEDEAMQGMLRGAKNIPTQDISGRLAEIPKDKEVITHCVTGVRAEMAFNVLKDAGYKVRFLNANIKIDKDGKYEITKE